MCNVHSHEFCVSCGRYTIEQDFCYQHICCGCCYLTGIIYPVPSDNETYPVFIGFFIVDIADKRTISNILSSRSWDVVSTDKLDCVCGIFLCAL